MAKLPNPGARQTQSTAVGVSRVKLGRLSIFSRVFEHQFDLGRACGRRVFWSRARADAQVLRASARCASCRSQAHFIYPFSANTRYPKILPEPSASLSCDAGAPQPLLLDP